MRMLYVYNNISFIMIINKSEIIFKNLNELMKSLKMIKLSKNIYFN